MNVNTVTDKAVMSEWGPKVFSDLNAVSFADWRGRLGRDDWKDVPEEIGWGFTTEDQRTLAAIYRDGEPEVRERVLYVLEDCNFHATRRLIENEDYLGLAYRLRWENV